MRRRQFLMNAVGATAGTLTAGAIGRASAMVPEAAGAWAVPPGTGPISPRPSEPDSSPLQHPAVAPMAVGLFVRLENNPEAEIAQVHALGMSNCFLFLDSYLGKYSDTLAQQVGDLLKNYSVVATAAEVVGPPPVAWDFYHGPLTLGLVPRATRSARMDALKQTSDFAKLLGIAQVQTHCGYIPEDPADPVYDEVVLAIREVAQHCAGNGQLFLMETGQETPTTTSRVIHDVDQPNLGVGLDVANLILFGKANPVDAVDIIGPYVRSFHAKDGRWPTDPMQPGAQSLIGTGLVDFPAIFTRLHRLGYAGAVTIETSKPKQIAEVPAEKQYLEGVIARVTQRSGMKE
jgi:L-ribulose-5-phosphate 3-epimerase